MPVTSYAAKYAAKKFLRKEMDKNKDKKPAGQYDPYFVMIPHPRKPGKFKKVKKQIPEYIPEEDAVVLAKVRHRAYQLDCCLFTFLGVRFGWSSVIGLVPAIGDGIDAALAVQLVWTCHKVKCGIPFFVMIQMLFNIAFDFLVGLIPFVGDLLDAGYRANTKNVRLLEEVLDKKYKPGADRLRDKNNGIPPATEIEFFSDEENDRRSPVSDKSDDPPIPRPKPARVPTETRGGERAPTKSGRHGWFSNSRGRQADLEMGHDEPEGPVRSKPDRGTRR